MARIHRKEHVETGEIDHLLRMTDQTRENCNRQLEADNSPWRWRIGGYVDRKPQVKSLAPVLRLLDLEGFSDEMANQIIRYWRRKRTSTERETLDRLESEFKAFAGKYPRKTRKLIGRFIGSRMSAAFDAGLRAGLMAGIAKAEVSDDGDTDV